MLRGLRHPLYVQHWLDPLSRGCSAKSNNKSDFVAASRFSTEKERARGRAGFLFGDQETETGGESSPVRKGKNESKEDKDGDEEGIDLITIESSDDAALVTKAR